MTALLLALLSLPALAGGLPSAELSWRKGTAVLDVGAPAGEHVDPASPARLALSLGEEAVSWEGSGATLLGGLRLPAVQGPVQGSLRVSFCEDGGTLCRVVDVGLQGVLAGAKGRTALVVEEGAAPGEAHGVSPHDAFAADPEAAVAAALQQATASGRPVLLDFGAVWCPPCNLMAAEVLHDPADAERMAGFGLVTIDADRGDSWALKDRYAVGGYPTVVAVDGTGREVARMVGYPGEAAFVAWLDAVGEGLDLGVMLAEPQPPVVAAGLAWELARQGQEDAARTQLEAALHDPQVADRLELRRARLVLQGEADAAQALADLDFLAAHETSAEDALVWAWSALSLAQAGSEHAGRLQARLLALAGQAPPVQAADLLAAARELEADEGARRGLAAAAAVVLQQALSGDPERDRGHELFLSELLIQAGQAEAGLGRLQRARERWPEDFTFHFALAGRLHELGRDAEALEPGRLSLERSYGDNRLRAAKRLADILHALGQDAEALELVRSTLQAAERPAEGLDVRTPRYLKALEDLRAELGG